MTDPKIHTRKQFLQYSSSMIAAGLLSRHLIPVRHDSSEPADPATVHTLALRAVDAARSAGAQYADVRLTRTCHHWLQVGMNVTGRVLLDDETLAVGVRAFVNGYWGFAASPYWDADEVVRLAQDAVAAAKQNATGPARAADLGTYPVATGTWIMPVRVDPFHISLEDKYAYFMDLLATAQSLVPRRARTGGRTSVDGGNIHCNRQDRALATTDGTMIMQTVYDTSSDCIVSVYNAQGGQPVGSAAARGITRAGRGWEMFDDARLLDQLPTLVDEAEANAVLSQLPVKPVDVGRFDMVYDATTVAGVLDATLGRATAVDRALGYEANASGTSYLGPDPFTYLGTSVASPLVTVTANRSLAGGLATVKWDDEGILPQDFSLVSQGTLVDYQTTREQATWLAPWYAKQQQPVRSHGCAAAADASGVTMQMAPNLALTPSASATTVADLIAGTTTGIALLGGRTTVDFQSRSGAIRANPSSLYEIRNGKLVAQLTHGGVLFSTTEFWKNVTALGGAASSEHVAMNETKGEPQQTTAHTVSAVPMAVKNMAIIDVTRRA